MTSRPSPRIATWLLQRCLRGRHAESLVGDLLELHQGGKSRWWYWRQVLAAVGADVVDAVRASGRSLVVAVLVGWCAILLWRETNEVLIAHIGDLYGWLRHAGVDRGESYFLVWLLGALLRFLFFVASGWLVARVNARHPALAIAVFVASVFLISVPWHQVRLPWHYAVWLVHYGMAVAGIAAGAWLAARQRQHHSMITGS